MFYHNHISKQKNIIYDDNMPRIGFYLEFFDFTYCYHINEQVTFNKTGQ